MRLYRFQDIKVSRVGKVATFQTLSFSGYRSCKGWKIYKNFRLYRFQDIKVARAAKFAKFQTLWFSGYQGFEGWKGCNISDIIVYNISKLQGVENLQNFRLYGFLDMKVSRVGKVARFQTLSFSGYQGCERCIGCKISDFIVFRRSKLPRL